MAKIQSDAIHVMMSFWLTCQPLRVLVIREAVRPSRMPLGSAPQVQAVSAPNVAPIAMHFGAFLCRRFRFPFVLHGVEPTHAC